MRYLLPLAYELNNQPDKAVQVYYRLWSDYPTYIFGLVAQLKHEPVP
jgi:hypothetical protein